MRQRLAENEIADALESTDTNQPQSLPGQGLSGPREKVEPSEARRRRAVMGRLLASGSSMDELIEVMGKPPDAEHPERFGLNENQVRYLVKEVYVTWSAEDAENRPHDKAAAVRRIKGHIRDARKGEKWTAVAMFEKTLALIEGTCEPIEVRHSGSIRVQEAILAVVGEMDEVSLRRLVDEELRFMGADSRDPSRTLMVDSESEVVAP